jgi:hypothetical protein
MKKTYSGSCHCGAIRFEADLDLAAGTTRCNCGFCRKARVWFAIVKAGDVRVLAGQDDLADYQYTTARTPEPFLHFHFCKRCGVRPFARGGFMPQLGSEFFAIYVTALDASDEELAATPIQYADGRHDAWQDTPAETRYL